MAKPELITGFVWMNTDPQNRQHGQVNLDCIQIPTFQRNACKGHKIKGTFQERICLPLVLSYRGGIIWIVDGRQRLEALRTRKIDRWRGILFTGLEKKEEAELFFLLNDVPMRMSAWERFRAGLEAEMPMQVTCKQEMDCRNLTWPGDRGTGPRNSDVTSCSALQLAYDGGVIVLKRFLSVLNEAWREGPGQPVEKLAKEVELQRALVEVIKERPEVTTERWVSLFRVHRPATILASAKDQPKSARVSKKQMRSVMETLVDGIPVVDRMKRK